MLASDLGSIRSPYCGPSVDVDLADRRPASACVEDDLPLQPRLAGLEQTGQFADGGGLADADTPDECDLVLTGLEETGEAADFLLVEVDLPHEDIFELWVLPELAQLSEGRHSQTTRSHGSGDQTRDVPGHPTFAWRTRQADEPSRPNRLQNRIELFRCDSLIPGLNSGDAGWTVGDLPSQLGLGQSRLFPNSRQSATDCKLVFLRCVVHGCAPERNPLSS